MTGVGTGFSASCVLIVCTQIMKCRICCRVPYLALVGRRSGERQKSQCSLFVWMQACALLKKGAGNLTSTASLGVAFPTVSFHLQHTKSSKRWAFLGLSCAQGNVGAAFCLDVLWCPLFRPGQQISLVASAAGKIHRMLLFSEK